MSDIKTSEETFKTKSGTSCYRSITLSKFPEEDVAQFAEYVDGIFRIVRKDILNSRFAINRIEDSGILTASIDPSRNNYREFPHASLSWNPLKKEGEISYKKPLMFYEQPFDRLAKTSHLVSTVNYCLALNNCEFFIGDNIGIVGTLPREVLVTFNGVFNESTYERAKTAISGLDCLLGLIRNAQIIERRLKL